jgi:hypothetical protein
MTVSYKSINAFAIILALLAVALFPFWPYSRWGYTPSVLVAVIVIFMLMYKRLARY